MTRFLRKQYEKVEIVFIAHHTEAKEVTEEEFFTRGESGGTICSSAYQKALDIIHHRYPLPNTTFIPSTSPTAITSHPTMNAASNSSANC